MNADAVQVVSLVSDISVVALLAIAIFGGYRGLYVWRWYYDERVKALTHERDEWRDIARGGLGVVEEVVRKA